MTRMVVRDTTIAHACHDHACMCMCMNVGRDTTIAQAGTVTRQCAHLVLGVAIPARNRQYPLDKGCLILAILSLSLPNPKILKACSEAVMPYCRCCTKRCMPPSTCHPACQPPRPNYLRIYLRSHLRTKTQVTKYSASVLKTQLQHMCLKTQTCRSAPAEQTCALGVAIPARHRQTCCSTNAYPSLG